MVKGERSIFYPADREKSYWPPEDHPMTLTDMRPLQQQMTIARNGFALVSHVTAVKNFFDPAEVEHVFFPEVIAEAKRLNGAVHAVAFGPVPRSDDPNSKQGRLPAFGAHVDYGRRTIEEMVRPLLGEQADYWFGKRVVLMNFWRPITTVYRTPLALCDASTVSADDMHPSEVRGGLDDPNRPPLHGFNLSYNPGASLVLRAPDAAGRNVRVQAVRFGCHAAAVDRPHCLHRSGYSRRRTAAPEHGSAHRLVYRAVIHT